MGDLKYAAIIFDLDGVICHTDLYHYKAWKSVADELGVYFDETINNRLRGVSRMQSLEIILERYEGTLSDAEKNEIATRKNNRYQLLLREMSHADLSQEVADTLHALRARGVQLAIGSSSKNAPLILERIGLNTFFDAISDGNNITRSKPDPQVFLMAADMLRLSARDCLVVEDAIAGIDAAKAGNFAAAALGDAYGYSQADYSIKSFSQLLDIV